jgi:DNA-directed RNA polymerase subunit E'/Rpb7
MVFFQMTIAKTLLVPPKCLGASLKQTARDLLVAEVEGTCIDGAYVVAVLRTDNLTKPFIEPLTGYARYEVTYEAIMLRPFKHEVLDASVTQAHQVRVATVRDAASPPVASPWAWHRSAPRSTTSRCCL